MILFKLWCLIVLVLELSHLCRSIYDDEFKELNQVSHNFRMEITVSRKSVCNTVLVVLSLFCGEFE